MPSSAEIANLALLKLGSENTLLALTDNTVEGRVMNRLFAPTVAAELRRHNWKFAIKRDALLALAEAPAWGYQYQYPVPADFNRLVQVNEWYVRGAKQQALWSVESVNGGRAILTNLEAPLKIRYVRSVENAGEFDPLFVQLIAAKLAYEGCEKITQSSTKKSQCADDYKAALKEAIRCDAIENPPDELPWGSWLDSREGLEGGSLYEGSQYPYAAGYQIL